ncbi:MAG TPA: ATP-grasp domain-containing protein, partial [Alphaproteobacteria bacterium]
NAAHALAEKIDLVGVLGVEMFVTRSGQILMNEIAPRPHNSGHWTMDACAVSQFEQQMRAAAGLPLGSFERHHDAVMTNLLGNDINAIQDLIKNEKAHVHDYGKREPKEGRKMGHVTIIS